MSFQPAEPLRDLRRHLAVGEPRRHAAVTIEDIFVQPDPKDVNVLVEVANRLARPSRAG